MDYVAQYGLFLAKVVTGVAALLFIVWFLGRQKEAGRREGRLEVRPLNRHYQRLQQALARRESGAGDWRACLDRWRRRREERQREAEKVHSEAKRPRLFILDFSGDLRASAVDALREEVSAVIQAAEQGDEVLLRLESAGGMVNAYGLAASQLERLRRAEIPLTVAVDKVAASGGYMMACVGERIIAAPFAAVGSIGVVAQLPNLHRFLERHDIDFEQFTAGEYKRTVTVFGENTPAAKAKFQKELETVHDHFKTFVSRHRPQLELERVATGEVWLGEEALTLGLVDEIGTSDDFLLARRDSHTLLALSYHTPRQRRWPWDLRGLWGRLAALLRAG